MVERKNKQMTRNNKYFITPKANPFMKINSIFISALLLFFAACSNNDKKEKEQPEQPVMHYTAWVDRDGQLNFRDDVYEHDMELMKKMFTE